MGYKSGWSQQLRDYVARQQGGTEQHVPAVGKRVRSQAEIDYYGALDAGETPEITQAHLDEIGVGEGGEGLTTSDVGPANEPNPDEEPEEMPGFTSEHHPLEPTDEDSISVGATDTTENALAGGSLMTGSGSSKSSSVGGGYGKQRIAQQSRKQMNLTQGRKRSILTS